MSQPKSLRKRKALIPNEISVAIKTPKSKQYLYSEATTSSSTKESEHEDEIKQAKKSKKKKLRRTQYCSPFINSSKNKSNSRDSNNEKRKMISSDNSDMEVICESKEQLKSKKKKKFKLPLVNLNDLEVVDNLSENSKRDDSCRKKDSTLDIIGRILQVEEVASSKGGKSKSKKKKFEAHLINLEDLEVMDSKAQSKKNVLFDSLSSEIEEIEPISRNSTDVKRRLRSSNNSNIEVICQPNEKAKSKKKRKVKLPVLSLDLEVRDNSPIRTEGDDSCKEKDSPIDSIGCISHEIASSKREKSKSKKKKDVEVELKRKISSEKNILSDSQSNKLEAKEDINARRNKKRKTSQREENLKCSDQTEESGETDGNYKNSSISKRCSKRSTVSNSRSSDQAEKSDESIKIQSFKGTNKTKKILDTKSNDISEESEENIKISKVSKRSSKLGKSRFTDQFEETNESLSVDKPLTRNNSRISNSEYTDPTGVPIRFSSSFKSNIEEVKNSIKEDQTSNLCTDQSNKPEQNVENNENVEGIISINECYNSINGVDCDKNGQNEIRSRNNSFKLSFENGISMSNQKKRKRWTIDPQKTVEVKNDTKKMSLSITSGNKRVARKRWSTELKKKLADSTNYSIIEINESLATNDISKNGHSKNLSNSSSSSTSRKSTVSTQEVAAPVLDLPLLNNSNPRDDTIGKTQNEILTSDSNTKKHNDNSQELSLRRSRRYSKSLEGISVLEETIKLESTGGTAMLENDSRNSGNSTIKTPGSILKRRGTYDLDVSVTDVSILRSLSESNLSNNGLGINQNESKDEKKKVKFQHVNVRKKCDGPSTKKSEPQVANTKKPPSILTAANKSVSFDQTMFSAASCPTSTPLHSSKMNSLQKKILTKENLGSMSNKRSRSVDEEKNKIVRRIRMPNFTRIHQERMNRMEDISQMAERKAERAKLLLSGLNPASQSTSINNKTPKQVDTEQPKQIKFTRNNQLPSTSVNSNIKHKENESNLKLQDKSKNQTRFAPVGLIGKSGIPGIRKPAIIKTKTTQIDDILKKSEQIKSIATKSKPQRDTREDRRTILKGVRGNRRFELLMKMRNK